MAARDDESIIQICGGRPGGCGGGQTFDYFFVSRKTESRPAVTKDANNARGVPPSFTVFVPKVAGMRRGRKCAWLDYLENRMAAKRVNKLNDFFFSLFND